MLTLAHPWLLALLPAPLLVWWLWPPYAETRQAMRAPFVNRIVELTGIRPSASAVVARRSRIQRVLTGLVWVVLLVAAARPQRLEPPLTKVVPTRDLLLAVDLSGSMDIRDFTDDAGETVDRLTAVKQVLDEFLARREGDRVGLILFGTAPFLQAPFTDDLDVCRALLDEAQVRMAGPKTMLGDAIGLALNVFERSEVEERVLIVLTDGNDTGSQMAPADAAAVARDRGVTIHTVAVGDPTAAGEEKLDIESLRLVSEAAGGRCFVAADREELAQIYDELDRIETREVETQSVRPRRDLFHWPLAGAMLLVLAFHLMALTRTRRIGGSDLE